MELANQLADLIFRTSGVNQELLGMASDTDTGIETMLKQGAGLVTLQKYFDQWDVALKQMGVIDHEIMKYNWSATKVSRILGKNAPLEFQTKIFSQYTVLVQEGVNTTVQQQAQFIQIMKLNEMLGGILPPKFLVENSLIHGKKEIIEAIEQQQQSQQQIMQQEQMLKQAQIEAQIQGLQARSISDIGLARERNARSESNLGLYEERLSSINQNRSKALLNRIEALEKLVGINMALNPVTKMQSEQELEALDESNIRDEDLEKEQVQSQTESNKFLENMMQNINNRNMQLNQLGDQYEL